jgi:hypothetical protein
MRLVCRASKIETARSVLEAMVHGVTGVKAMTLHHDISTVTAEIDKTKAAEAMAPAH